VKDSTKLEVTNRRENQSKSTKEISSVNKYPDVTEKALHCYILTLSPASHYCLKIFYMHNGMSIYQTSIV